MSILQAIILGIVQGLSEFLPISSTAHLTLTGRLMGVINMEHPEQWTAFIAVIQLGTMAAVVIYFFKDILNIIKEFLSQNLFKRVEFKQQSLHARLGWFIIGGTMPIVVFGLGLKKIIEGTLTKNLLVIACSLIVLAVVLAIAEKTAKFKKNIVDMSLKDAIIIGIAQSFALIPGASRSGTTITGGLFCGLNREAAARFSFLLSIPAVFASGLLELKESLKFMDKSALTATMLATLAAGLSGYLAIDLLLKFLRKRSTFVFINYRIVLGVLLLILLFKQVILP
ncbi:MAG: undecaprenyl-diphosphatase UppP [Ignavibacteria bacterium]|nr:undecaprenyl-diphosphatase UppP [Ignavibacteria bacterium]